MNSQTVNTTLFVECLVRMAKVLLNQRKDTPTTGVEAGEGVSKGGDAESTTALSLLPECRLVKRQGGA